MSRIPPPPEELTMTAIAADVMAQRVREPRTHRERLQSGMVAEMARLENAMDEDAIQKSALRIAALAVRIVENK